MSGPDMCAMALTCHGRPIARIVPEIGRRQVEIDKAVANIRALRHRTGNVTLQELLSFRHEGHNY
jgi:antitoxin (DNA-binding transcriptional repressor) of toxin-antitoxin stability system